MLRESEHDDDKDNEDEDEEVSDKVQQPNTNF